MWFSIVMLVYQRVYKVVKQLRFLFHFFFHQTTMYGGFITSWLFCSLQFANHFNHLLTSFFHTIRKSIPRSIRNTFIKVAPQIHTRPNVVIRCPHEKTSSFSFRLGHAPQSSPISLDPLLALRQMIAAVEWCLAKEERNAGGVSSMAWSCVQAEMGQKRLAEDGWALLRMHPLDERCPLSHNFTMFYVFFGGYEVVTPGGDGKEIAICLVHLVFGGRLPSLSHGKAVWRSNSIWWPGKGGTWLLLLMMMMMMIVFNQPFQSHCLCDDSHFQDSVLRFPDQNGWTPEEKAIQKEYRRHMAKLRHMSAPTPKANQKKSKPIRKPWPAKAFCLFYPWKSATRAFFVYFNVFISVHIYIYLYHSISI